MNLTKAIILAEKTAMLSNMKFKLGAVLFDDSNYTKGCNTKLYNKSKFSIHAEEQVIIKANRILNFNFKNSTLVIVRINKQGTLRRSFPCLNCQKLIHKMEIKTIYYIG